MFFKFTTAGESHGKALITIIEGLPAGLSIDIAAVDHELWRRQQGVEARHGRAAERDELQGHGKAACAAATRAIGSR